MERKMYLGAPNVIFENAKALRANQTAAEIHLWDYLKLKPLGFRFRRQHPIKLYIADFYCHSLKLIIEVDGEIHDLKEVKQNDNERQKFLEDEGIFFLRFTNDEIKQNFVNVKTKIENYLSKRSVTPKS